MNAETELINAYRDWLRLARAEAKAIRTHNWDLLYDCQLAIADFQTLITHLTAEARREWQLAGIDCAEKERHIKIYISELIELTQQNQSTLQCAKDEAGIKLVELAAASQNVKLLQRSYGSLAFAT
jgi:hypothetical protein